VSHIGYCSDRVWRRVALLAALAAGLAVPGTVWADVPPATSLAASGRAEANRLVGEAKKAIQEGNGRLALVHLKNALTLDSHHAVARIMLGEVLNLMGDSGGAERELRQARKDGAPPSQVLPPLFQVMLSRSEFELLLNNFPDPGANSDTPAAADVLWARAMALQGLRKPSEAVDAMDRSLALRRDASGLLARARLALSQGDLAGARKFADEAIPKATTPQAMLFKAGLLMTTNENQAALDVTNQLLANYPGNLSGRLARIEAYLALRQDDKAKPEIDDIIAKYPRTELALYYQAFLLARAGQAKEAWRIAQSLSGPFRDSQPRVALVVAEMATNAGNEETATSILERLLLKDPTSVPARLLLASMRLKQNNAGQALKILEPIKDSPDLRVQEMLGNSYIGANRLADALNALHKADANGKAPPSVKRSIAVLEMQAGDRSQGIKNVSQMAAKNPTDINLAAPLIQALVEAKRFSEALAVAGRLGDDPKLRSRSFMLRGSIFLTQGNNSGAEAAFDKAVAADPKDLAALFARGRYRASVQRFSDAEKDMRAIVAQDPKNLEALLTLAEMAEQQSQDRNVRTLLGQAIAAAPQSAVPRLTLIRYQLQRGDPKGALQAANELVQIQPSNRDGLALLGDVQLALGQKKEAVATYRRLATLAPTAAGPQVLLGNALLSSGDRAGSARAMEVAVSREPASAEIRAAQVQLLLKQGNNNAALATARAFQAANPGAAADLLLAETLYRTKQHDQAVAVLNKSLAEKPTNTVLLRLSEYAFRAKDAERATAMLSNWLEKNPNDLSVRLAYANVFMGKEDRQRAVAQYETILKQNPSNVIALNNLGYMMQTSDPKRALSLLVQAQKLAPNSPDIADSLGWVKLQQKDVPGALDLLNKAHTLNPKDGEITYHLARALDASGKRDAARGLLNALLASNVQFKDRPAAVQLAAGWR